MDPLNIKFQDEIKYQVIEAFQAKGLSVEMLEELKKTFPILYPWDEDYNLYRNNYNRRFTYFPMGIIRCCNVGQVQSSLAFVRKYALEFAVRSGAHCYLTYSLSTGIIIDLSRMDEIKVVQNEESLKCSDSVRSGKFVILGPGARLGLVVQEISKFGVSLPLGSCVNTCAGGISLGGGISPSLIRLGGLMCDHIESIEMVLSSGEVVNVNRKHKSDLFWALRGAGGGNFGIVTKFVFNPCKFKGAMVFSLLYPFGRLKKVVKLWQEITPRADRKLSCELDLVGANVGDDYPVNIRGQFEGCEEELMSIIKPFIYDDVKVDIQFLKTFADTGIFWGGTKQSYFENLSMFWYNEMSSDAIDVIIHYLKRAKLGASIEFNSMGGRVRDGDSVFPYRKALFWCQLRGTTLEPMVLEEQQRWVHKLYDSLVPYVEKVHGTVPGYINAPQEGLCLKNYFGKNLDKLRKIKKKYDPDDVFSTQLDL